MTPTQATSAVIRFTVPGRAVAAVRMTRRGLYTPGHRDRNRIDAHLAWRETVGWTAKQNGAVPLDGRLYARLWFYLNKRGRADWDNLAKLAIDGCQGVCFHNDNQLDDVLVRILSGHPTEYVDVEIGQLPEREAD